MSRMSDAIRETRQKNLTDGVKANQAVKEAAEAAKETGEVVFYAWIDGGNQSQPSSMTVRISGGQRVRDPQSGSIAALGYKEIRFNMGILRTSDQEVIDELRKLMAGGDTITEDMELYLSKIEKPELRAQRLARRSVQDREDLKKKDAEIAELKAKLAAAGSASAAV